MSLGLYSHRVAISETSTGGTYERHGLALVLAADVGCYSRLIGTDKEATLKTLGASRDIIDGLIARHDERVFGTAGDSVVAEFGSAVEGVRASISIQEKLKTRNAELAEGQTRRGNVGCPRKMS